MKMRLRTATPFPKDASARPLGKKADVGWKGCRPRLAVRARHIRRGGLDGVCQLNGAFGDLAGAGSEVLGALLADKNESRGSEQRGTEQDHHENVSEILKCDVEHGCLPFSNLHSYRCQARLFGSTQTLRRRAVLTAAIRRTQVVLLGLALGADGEGAEDAERERALERFVLAVAHVVPDVAKQHGSAALDNVKGGSPVREVRSVELGVRTPIPYPRLAIPFPNFCATLRITKTRELLSPCRASHLRKRMNRKRRKPNCVAQTSGTSATSTS